MPPILAAERLCQRFGPVQALDSVSLSLRAGEVTAIVGENGAGKSTLARILAGVMQPDGGVLTLAGKPVVLRSRAQAIRAGIGFVPQALSFVATFSIIENHCLSQPEVLVDRASAARALEGACKTLGMSLPLDRPVEQLSLAQRQLGEVASAIAGGSRIVLLDEPTAALGPAEIGALVLQLRRLAELGVAIGLITHRIREVLQGADRVVVLRHGIVAADQPTAGLDEKAVARLMIGGVVQPATPPHAAVEPLPALVVRKLEVRDGGRILLSDIDLEIGRGEILGVAGVAGASQSALAETVAGLLRPDSGILTLDGRKLDPHREPIGYVPEDRTLGLAPELDVATNASLLRLREPGFARFGMRRRAAEAALARGMIERFDIRPPRPEIRAGTLSGGNQQKLLVAREIEFSRHLLVLHGPTQGLDLAASAGIHAAVIAAAARGMAILLISSDLDEILALSHRIVVLTGGNITARFDRGEAIDADRLGHAMTGGTAMRAEMLEAG